jgi:DNA-binding transcriptional regulator YdaS (Cro superfamily)
MDLKTYVQELPRGTMGEFAEKARVLRVLLSQWTADENPRQVPVDRCPDIERASDGVVTCEEMRPDVRWHRVADVDWVWHPEGRPLLEVARVAA